MMNNEQWKSGGDCSICRRKSYCSKLCSAANKSIMRKIYGKVAETMSGAFAIAMGAYATLENENREESKSKE